MTASNLFPTKWILLRGLTRGAFHWLDFPAYFKDFFQGVEVFTPELAGNGLLFEELSPMLIDQAVLQLRQQIALNENEKIGIFSVSMGAMIATKWSEMFPDEVNHLVLVNSSFSSLSPFYHRLLPKNYPGIAENFLVHNPAKMEDFIMNATSNDESKWRPHFEKLVQFQIQHPVSLSNFIRQLKLSGQADFKQKPKARVLILSSLKDQLVSCKCSDAIAKSWNNPIEFHPSAGHDLALDAPEWAVQQMKNFFKF